MPASGWKLLNADDTPGPITTDAKKLEARAFYPITFPLTVGPGTISAAITIGASLKEPGVVLAASAGEPGGLGRRGLHRVLQFPVRGGLIRFLGKTGTLVMMRLSSFILMCVGVQIITNGIIDVFHAVEHR